MTRGRSGSSWRDLQQHLDEPAVVVVEAPGFPAPTHPAEADVFDRQQRMPGHDQARLECAHLLVVGCGGLGSWAAVMLARLGVRRLTLADPDRFDRSNLHRQLAQPEDLGRPKAHALARRLGSQMANAGTITGIAKAWPEAESHLLVQPDGLLVGVDNNRARLDAARYATRSGVPAVFVMLSADGQRVQVVLQVPDGACLSCLLPNLNPDRAMPCAAASAPVCAVAAGHAVQVLAGWLMGRRDLPRWRETSLDGGTERVARAARRCSCAPAGR